MTTQNYAKQILHNRSFQGVDLTDADFSGSDLRGCDFTGATLVGANFEGATMGQSREQVNRLIAAAVMAPAAIVGLSILAVQIPVSLFGERFYESLNFMLGGLPLIVLFLEIFCRDIIALNFPRTTNWLGISAVAGLFQIMVAFTIWLLISSLFSFGNGEGAQGFFMLLLAGISAIVTRRIFKWVIESIQSSGGTSFRTANLTNANLSRVVAQNTDFCFAVMTGVCIFEWVIRQHTQFTQASCEYFYLEPGQQKRYPAEGKFRQSEVEAFLLTRR
ncbi:MAG: pentapeptide repeat-containing protein [Kovacikia sp.]